MLNKEYWFTKKEKKYLHNIDTFYYTVKLHDDFTDEGTAFNVEHLRRMIRKYSGYVDSCPFTEVDFDMPVLYRKGCYARFYTFRLEVPEQFDVYIAPIVPNGADTVASVTSEIVVQIRSRMLWELGAKLAFDKSFEFVKSLCTAYELSIAEVKENRVDFCWHTNAIQEPESYFKLDRVASMQVSQFKRLRQDAQLLRKNEEGKKEYEIDYISLGKRGDKCYVRFYLKTKEVVQQGYKGWFFYQWLFNGLINRYDLYVLEKAYIKKRWEYINIARLQFVLEHDDTVPEVVKSEMRALIESGEREGKYNYAAIDKLADKYTPAITKVLNVEYETHRRMTKSFVLVELKDNQGVAKRVYDFLDNRRMITDYLTHYTLRLVDRNTNSVASRCDYTDFWRRLRNTKQVDVTLNKRNLKLVRDYSSILNLEVRKQRAVKSVSAFAVTVNHSSAGTIYEDTADLLSYLNDNDIHSLHNYKQHYLHTLKHPDDPEEMIELSKLRHVRIMNEDGEIFESRNSIE